jgi:hypothetical protein
MDKLFKQKNAAQIEIMSIITGWLFSRLTGA